MCANLSASLEPSPCHTVCADVLSDCHCRNFTDTALTFSMTILNAVIDLVSFSEILYTIYPPLFVVLVVYSVGGTAISLKLGQKLVGLNFQQEAQEANYRYCTFVQSGSHDIMLSHQVTTVDLVLWCHQTLFLGHQQRLGVPLVLVDQQSASHVWSIPQA